MEIIIPFQPTLKQLELFQDQTRFKVAVWGRRSGKSTYALNLAIRTAVEKPGAKIWIVLPTYGQAKDIYWNDAGMVDRFILREMQAKTNVSDLSIVFPNNSIIQFKGADNFESLRGSGLDLLICDEFSEWRYPQRAWESLRPALSDKNGKALFIGTPKGDNYFKALYEYGQPGGDPQWKSWRIPTWESGAPWTLTPEGKLELETLRAQKADDWYMQEYGAEFRKFTGLVFKTFERTIHVKSFEVDIHFPIEAGMDFGWLDPTVCLFTYFDDQDNCYVFDEYYQAEKTVREHAGRLAAMREKYPHRLKSIMGDSSAAQTIKDFANYDWHVTPAEKGKDSVVNGIERIQDKLKVNIASGRPRLIIHPRCEHLIYEMEHYRWKDNRAEGLNNKEEPEDADNHCVDSLRYVLAHHQRQSTNKKVIKAVSSSYKPRGGTY